VTMKEYDPKPLAEMLKRLLQERGESYRGASMRAGLDYGALFRFVEQGRRPSKDSLITLAEYFKVNPNDLLQLAGYPRIRLFDDVEGHIPPELTGIVQRVLAVEDIPRRARLIRALEEMLDLCASGEWIGGAGRGLHHRWHVIPPRSGSARGFPHV